MSVMTATTKPRMLTTIGMPLCCLTLIGTQIARRLNSHRLVNCQKNLKLKLRLLRRKTSLSRLMKTRMSKLRLRQLPSNFRADSVAGKDVMKQRRRKIPRRRLPQLFKVGSEAGRGVKKLKKRKFLRRRLLRLCKVSSEVGRPEKRLRRRNSPRNMRLQLFRVATEDGRLGKNSEKLN